MNIDLMTGFHPHLDRHMGVSLVIPSTSQLRIFFFTDAHQEVFDIRTTSIHDILYRTDPSYISAKVLTQAEKIQSGLGKTQFSWYHVPANNVSKKQT